MHNPARHIDLAGEPFAEYGRRMVISPAKARALFPSGLGQPAGSFRFSQDALLLASFTVHCLARRAGPVYMLDLGCGCGVIGLACLLQRENAVAMGADREPELIAAAKENAVRLGMESRYSAVCRDFADKTDRMLLAAEKADAVLANMPYRQEGTGRLPCSAMRRRALFADASTMPAFLQTAGAALKPGGLLALLYPWAGRGTLFTGLDQYGFFAKTILPVCAVGEEETFCLVAAKRETSTADVLPPLQLRAAKGGAYTAEALSFCPWL